MTIAVIILTNIIIVGLASMWVMYLRSIYRIHDDGEKDIINKILQFKNNGRKK